MAREKSSPKDISGERGVFDVVYTCKGVLISYVISMILLLAVSAVAVYAAMNDGQIRIAVNVVTALSLIVCGFHAARKARRMGLVNGAVAGLIYAVLLYLIGCAVAQQVIFSFSTVTTLILGFVCGGLGGIMGINLRRRKR